MRSGPDLRIALVLAAGGHLAVAGALRLAPAAPRPTTGAAPVVEIAFDEMPLDPPLESAVADVLPPPRAGADERPGVPMEPAAAPAATPLESGGSAETSAADRSWSFDPTARSPAELGIGTHWKRVVGEGAGPEAGTSPEAEARATGRTVSESMSDMLAERDVALGLGRGGPLVTAAREAASSPDAPAVGTTILEVEGDASGRVTAARADDHAWDAVAAGIVQRMAGKALRVRPGARGIRARLRVVAELSLPAGTRGTSSPGAVPDDIAGGKLKVCEGEGWSRRCLAGMPVGVTGSVADVSNLGAAALRVVHAQLLGEVPL